MEAREGKDVVTLEIDFGGRINRSWRRMECGYPGLGTGQIIRKLCDQIETRAGEAGKKKKRFPTFLDFATRRKGIVVSREDGDEAWRGKFTSDLNI